MSVTGKKAGLVLSLQRSFSMLASWRKGKTSTDAVLDSQVVLIRMKLLGNFHEGLCRAEDSVSTITTLSEQDSDLTEASKVNSLLQDRWGQPGRECGYLSDIFSDSQLPRLYKVESDDSGVELPSGDNSPSTPTGSEHSFVLHRRQSSCNPNSDSTTLHQQLHHSAKNVDTERFMAQGNTRERDEEMSGQLEVNSTVTAKSYCEDMSHGKQPSNGAFDDRLGNASKPEPICRSVTSDNLAEYMDECCRLSEAQQASSSPLGYLERICQLMERISQLQETNLWLQRHICNLHKEVRMTMTKEEFFQQHCSCCAASLAFQKTQSRSECLSASVALSDLSTIPEFTWHPLISDRRDMSSAGLTAFPLWRRSLNPSSSTDGEVYFLTDRTQETLSFPQLSDKCTWGKVKDLVRKTKMKNRRKLGYTSPSLKMSCQQLYM